MLPNRNDITNSLVTLLSDSPKGLSPKEAYSRLANIFNLGADDLTVEDNQGRSKWEHEVRWARQDLVVEGRVDPSVRACWRLKRRL